MKIHVHRAQRIAFAIAALHALRLVWPVLSGLAALQVGVGALIGVIEGWGIGSGIYFAFVTGLTVGYGDLAPSTLTTRCLAILIALLGTVMTGLIAAIGVAAIQSTFSFGPRNPRSAERSDRTRRSAPPANLSEVCQSDASKNP